MSARKGLIDGNIDGNTALSPKLLINNHNEGNKVLSNITTELKECRAFKISVAFITSSGLVPLLQTLKELQEAGIKGQILTTNYLNFSEPKALKRLMEFSNIELRMYTKDSFHTKGYIFEHKDCYRIIIGSSNLTQTALTKNKEWNIRVSSLEEGALTEEVIHDFNAMWNDSSEITPELIDAYEEIYKKNKEYIRKTKVPSLEQYKLQPNKMQVAAIAALDDLRAQGKEKGLLISATGTGKTYLSAFDLRNFKAERALFVVHREGIARKSIESFRNVFGDTKSMGLLSGTSKEIHCDFVFSTVQTLCKEETLSKFSSDEFDYIIIDEVHKAGAVSYQKIVGHFKPEFLLGMTATPERNDDFNIFEMFDYNIAYEIRLQQALEEDLLCPFHYFGIEDISVDGHTVDDNTDFKYLIEDQRVDHILEKAEFYGYSGEKVKGLVFCSSKLEACELSKRFNERGFNTVALTGDSKQTEREDAIKRLESDNSHEALDYIFTVDIFNEGIDIPSVNQVIMLRATKSAIIFVQQLGRGLRKNNDKEYVVVIDFVGNYDKNFLIPVALSGDRTYNKDNFRKFVMEGNRVIPGCSTINFDKISRKRIFESIDKVKFNSVSFIKENYYKLKEKIGRIPDLQDFDKYKSIDPLRIFENKGLGSLYNFLCKYEKDYTIRLDEIEKQFVEFLSRKLASGKRIHELSLIKFILEGESNLMNNLENHLKRMYGIKFKDSTRESVVNVLTNEFPTGSGRNTYKDCIFIQRDNGDFKVSDIFKEKLDNQDFRNIVWEIVNFGINRFEKNYSNRYRDTSLVLYKKYTYEDVCRLLEWSKCEVATNIGGYKFHKDTKTYPVFINYDKSEDINSTINYEDRFESPERIIAISKSKRTANSPDVKQAYNAKTDGVQMSLFVRKNKDDKVSKEFYFLGNINTLGHPKEFIMKNTSTSAVEINYYLHTPVREDIYDYLVNN